MGREQLIQSERRAHAVRNELEETKTQLEHADRQRRNAEQELSDVMEQVADCTLQNHSWSMQIVSVEMQNRSFLMSWSKLLIAHFKINLFKQVNVSLIPRCKQCMLIWKRCSMKPEL